ncbi:nuclear protein localization protein 4 [Blyttiomyces sp. JEL0837]|nr:nuclear protein localization protein 4 [Blyttiomyces sp. JEL0837]
MQDAFPVASKYSSVNKFGSRFVTCVISGDTNSQVNIECYQVSNAAVAMTRDKIIEASVDPSLMRVKASSNEQYIPEVFYKYKNKYGIMVKEPAKPTFPVEYLLVTLSHGFPQDPKPLFRADPPFAIENRGGVSTQDIPAVKRQVERLGQVALALSDFHMLLFLKESEILDPSDITLAASIARTGSDAEVNKLVMGGGWQTLMMIASESAAAGTSGGGVGSSSGTSSGARGGGPWTCRHCTFVNFGGESCEVCGLPNE